jgi:hypothetical protein
MYTNWHHSNVQSFHYTYGTVTYIHGAIPLALLSPCRIPFVSPLHSLLLTWHPPSCDRNRPPRSQVACKLTPFAPPFTQPTPSLQIPRTPTAPRLTKTTSGIFRLLLSGTPDFADNMLTLQHTALIDLAVQSGLLDILVFFGEYYVSPVVQ